MILKNLEAEDDWSTMWNKKGAEWETLKKEGTENREMVRFSGNVRFKCKAEKLWCCGVKRVT